MQQQQQQLSQASLDAGEAEACGARLNRQDTGCCTVWKLVAVQQQQQQLSQASLDAGEAKAGGAPPKYTGHWVLHCMEASTLCSDSSSSFHRPL